MAGYKPPAKQAPVPDHIQQQYMAQPVNMGQVNLGMNQDMGSNP